MKPLVSPGYAYFCSILSIFAIVILGVIAILFTKGASALVDGLPKDVSGADAAQTCIATIIVYAVFLVFCGSQVVIYNRDQRSIRL